MMCTVKPNCRIVPEDEGMRGYPSVIAADSDSNQPKAIYIQCIKTKNDRTASGSTGLELLEYFQRAAKASNKAHERITLPSLPVASSAFPPRLPRPLS